MNRVLQSSQPIRLLIVLFFVALAGASTAQRYSQEFGVIAKDEFDLELYSDDPEAEALILFDVGDSYFLEGNTGFDIKFTHSKRLKIFTSAGFDYAEIEIPYYVEGNKRERVEEIEAFTYNQLENGTMERISLNQQDIFDEVKNKYYRVKKFAFPGVKAGSIIEYRYKLISPFKFNLPDWAFQSTIPTLYSKYTVRMVPFYEYIYLMQGGKFDSHRSYTSSELPRYFGSVKYNDFVHEFTKKNIPAFKDETFISSTDDYIIKMDFQLTQVNNPNGLKTEIITTWPKLIEELNDHENFGKYIKKAQKFSEKTILPSLNLSNKTQTEKAGLLVDYVKNDFSWDRYYAKYANQSVKEFYAAKQGNAAEINLFTIGLLNAAGIKAKPVLISTRDHGKITMDYPFSHFFNYVVIIIELESGKILTDATEPLLTFDRLPPFCFNDNGLIIDEAGVGWVGLESPKASLNNYTISQKPDPDSLKSTILVSSQMTEFEGLKMHKNYGTDDRLLTESLEKGEYLDVHKVSFPRRSQNSQYSFAFTGACQLERVDGKFLISPFLNLPIDENPLKYPSRTYPVDFTYKTTDHYQSIIEIPEGYRVTYLPSNQNIDDHLMTIKYNIISTDKSLTVDGQIEYKKAVYSSGEYLRIKNRLDTIVKTFNDQIVLEKID